MTRFERLLVVNAGAKLKPALRKPSRSDTATAILMDVSVTPVVFPEGPLSLLLLHAVAAAVRVSTHRTAMTAFPNRLIYFPHMVGPAMWPELIGKR